MYAIIAAAVTVARKEGWRRRVLWNNVRDFAAMTNHPTTSPIVSLVVGSESSAIRASKHMLRQGFHVTASRPPAVAPDACRQVLRFLARSITVFFMAQPVACDVMNRSTHFRLRVTLTAAHTKADLRRLVAALSQCVPGIEPQVEQVAARL